MNEEPGNRNGPISEDVLPSQPAEEEDEDETGVDFGRLLAAKGYGSANGPSKIPSRGIKDFEPHGTEQQQSVLQKSREAMYTVLQQERIHKPDSERAVWDPEENGAWVLVTGGRWGTGVGRGRRIKLKDQFDEDGNSKVISRQYLYSEEALWLLERGSLDIRWPSSPDKGEAEGLPMSLQAAHAVFIGGSQTHWLTPERYITYQYLKRAGYNVFRADDNWQSIPKYEIPSQSFWSIILNHWSFPTPSNNREGTGPLVRPASYRNYRDVYKSTLIIPFHSPMETPKLYDFCSGIPSPSITYHVYKPNAAFKKTNPGPPDFYISVVNARDFEMLKEQDLDSLLRQTPLHPPKPEGHLYAKLKNGVRNVILAIVDEGVTSFLNVSDAAFGLNPLWDRPPPRGPGKKGSGFKGRRRNGG